LKYDKSLEEKLKKESNEEYYAFIDIKLAESFNMKLKLTVSININLIEQFNKQIKKPTIQYRYSHT